MQIRTVRPPDVPVIVRFVEELADYERERDAVRITEEQVSRALFGPQPHLFGHLAVHDGSAVGMVLWFLNFSTWEGRHGIYVEDLYVAPAARGLGVGRALLRTLAQVCIDRDYARLELSVLDWNAPAIGFYRRLGAHEMDGWTVQRLAGGNLRALAASGPPNTTPPD